MQYGSYVEPRGGNLFSQMSGPNPITLYHSDDSDDAKQKIAFLASLKASR